MKDSACLQPRVSAGAKARDQQWQAWPSPFIVGAARSGTTLLRLMLDSHPQLAIPPETGFLASEKLTSGTIDAQRFFEAVVTYPASAPGWDDFQIAREEFRHGLAQVIPFTLPAGVRLFYRMYAARFGKPRWGDKTPGYCTLLSHIQSILPEARFIHLVRDGRDVAVSLREQWFSPGYDITVQAQHWRDNVRLARQRAAGCRYYLEIAFEDLLRNPESQLRRICDFVELEFDPAMLGYQLRAAERLSEHRARCRADGTVLVTNETRRRQQLATRGPLDLSKIGAWRQSLTDEECRRYEATAGQTLKEFGYTLAYPNG